VKLLSMSFALVLCAVVQAMLPSWNTMGQAKVPLLLGASLYYALNYNRRDMARAALLAGLLQDALGMMPLGYSSICFCIVGLITTRFKDLIFAQQLVTHALLGGLSAAAVTFMLYIMMVSMGLIESSLGWLMMKAIGAGLLGALFVPLVCRVFARMDDLLGNLEYRR